MTANINVPAGAACGAIRLHRYASPCGELVLGELDGRLCLCDWGTRRNAPAVLRRLQHYFSADFVEAETDVSRLAALQLDEYFAGSRRNFTLPLLTAGTEFQQTVWHALTTISYGHTLSYGQLAQTLSRPQAVRAVAAAVGANALSLFLPCHRVTAAGGALTGYAGGLAAKRFLLALEQRPDICVPLAAVCPVGDE